MRTRYKTAVFLLLVAAPFAQAQRPVSFDKEPLTIQSGAIRHDYQVEIARSPEQQERGLMYRKAVPDNEGMLFINENERHLSMWMKNTLVPLDMLFINSGGKIVHIIENTEPLSTTPLRSVNKAQAVLEIAGGSVTKNNIQRGDLVIHPFFK